MLSTLCFLYLPSYEAEQETNRLLAVSITHDYSIVPGSPGPG